MKGGHGRGGSTRGARNSSSGASGRGVHLAHGGGWVMDTTTLEGRRRHPQHRLAAFVVFWCGWIFFVLLGVHPVRAIATP